MSLKRTKIHDENTIRVRTCVTKMGNKKVSDEGKLKRQGKNRKKIIVEEGKGPLLWDRFDGESIKVSSVERVYGV